MKNSKHINLLLIGLTALLLASCSSMKNNIREPEAYISYEKEEFDYSEQLTAEATSVRILGIDWKRLFSDEKGAISSSHINGLAPRSGVERLALYNLMKENPGYDFIVYPQYEVYKKAPGMGIFYMKIQVKATARLATTNDVIIEKGSAAPISKEMENSLASLQSAYDSLVVEVSEVKEECASKESELQKQVEAAEAKAAQAQTTSSAAVAAVPVANQSETPAETSTPPLSSNKMTSPSEVQTVAGTYTLIIGSYSNSENAERAVSNFNAKYADLKGRVGVVIAGEKFRIGFINFKTRNDAIAYKNSLIRKYPEFKDAWPYKP